MILGCEWSINLSPCSIERTCTISGSVNGLPFEVNIFVQASASRAFAPKPYTVSVGKLTSPPSCNLLEAFSIVSSLLGSINVLPALSSGP